MRDMIKGKTKLAPGIFEEFNYKCTNCGMMYGKQPSYCHSCGCNKLNKV